MNYIDLAIILLIAIFTFLGYQKGIFISLLEFIRYVVGLPLCFIVSDKYANPVYQSLVRPRALASIEESISNSSGAKEITASLEEAVNSLPPFIANSIDLSNISIKKSDVAEQILTKVFEPVLISLTKGVLFVLCFVAFFGITALALGIFRKARKRKEDKKGKSVLSKTDRLVGAVFGICKSFVTIVALSTVVIYIQGIIGNDEFSKQIDSSNLLPVIESINPINFLIGG